MIVLRYRNNLGARNNGAEQANLVELENLTGWLHTLEERITLQTFNMIGASAITPYFGAAPTVKRATRIRSPRTSRYAFDFN